MVRRGGENRRRASLGAHQLSVCACVCVCDLVVSSSREGSIIKGVRIPRGIPFQASFGGGGPLALLPLFPLVSLHPFASLPRHWRLHERGSIAAASKAISLFSLHRAISTPTATITGEAKIFSGCILRAARQWWLFSSPLTLAD